jgi:hypothetical protein
LAIRVEKVDELITLPKYTSFVEAYEMDGLFFFIFNAFGFFAVLVGFCGVVFFNELEYLQISFHLLFGGLATQIILFLGYTMSEPSYYQEFVKNQKGKDKYMINLAREVKQHLGGAVKSMVMKNLTGVYMLLSTGIIKRMGAIIGTTGSGKTWLLKGLMEQVILIGAACLTTDAKGTVDEFKRTFAMWWKFGVEKTSFLINFADQNNSHSISLFGAGTALMLKEMMVELIENDDPKWRGVDIAFIEALFKLLVWKRDHKDPNIQEDLTPNSCKKYLSRKALLVEAWKYRHVEDVFVQDFILYVTTSFAISYEEFLQHYYGEEEKEFYKQCVKASENSKEQGVYESGMAASNWLKIMILLGSNYGKIFNAKYPDITLFEAVQHYKNIWIILPTVESEDTAKKLGKLLVGQMKATAYKKITTSSEPEIPYVFWLDEYVKFAVKGFGDLMSVCRSLGMAIWVFFQDKAQLVDAVGEDDAKQTLNMANTLVIMKTKDDVLAEEVSKFVDKTVRLVKERNERREEVKGEGSTEDRYTREEKAAIEPSDFIQQRDGELFVQQGNKLVPGIGAIASDPGLTYLEKISPEDFNFELVKVYPKAKFMSELSLRREELFNNINYEELCEAA